MSPPTRRTGPREARPDVEVTTTDSPSLRQTSDIPAQLRRVNLDYADRVVQPCPACHCPRGEEVLIGGEWITREVRDRRCHPDQLSEWAKEGMRRHDEARRRARAFMNDPANAEAVAIIQEMLKGGAS